MESENPMRARVLAAMGWAQPTICTPSVRRRRRERATEEAGMDHEDQPHAGLLPSTAAPPTPVSPPMLHVEAAKATTWAQVAPPELMPPPRPAPSNGATQPVPPAAEAHQEGIVQAPRIPPPSVVAPAPEAPTSPFVGLPDGTPLDVNALAAAFGRSKRSVWRSVARGELPSGFRLMGRMTWTAGALRAHMQALQSEALRKARIRPVSS